MATSHVLYYRPMCPFCRKVLTYMESKGIELELKDLTNDEEARAELERVGGKAQVPCLFIDGKPMYESDDIIAYLAKTFA
ncbi:glutathione S-transferase N-terminal domain-containing protein [Collinsella sp. AGMB00827]|uniref:Glutathione S-transferase N-terminal domain-containing protein n=1 Tax=Collinsella ureilytica TaxID=2869515 RepID=A0ABS7MJ96_9ACTN|nr:glutathione S-transferase N-terminal domain-containing protein [Collinsella urealyticum]MBY4797155.1 glutathione S-transferase N-terminal domain-containing protein [Collinsella urealyticum]